jgi:transcriptional regulator with AAA-type ATPase domain
MAKRERNGGTAGSGPKVRTKPAGEILETGELLRNSGFEEDLVRLRFEQDVLHVFIEHARLNNGPHLRQFLENMEKTILCRLLERFNGSQKTTAKYLGIKYTTLHEKVKKHHICFFKQPVELSDEPKLISGAPGA